MALSTAVWQELVDLLGREYAILPHEAGTTPYQKTTLSSERVVNLGVLKPRTKKEVEAVVKIALKHKIHLYPLSRGNNWGFGSKAPVKETCLIIDLSRMNSILAFDADLGVITVEPGVTVSQVEKFFKEKALPFMAPVVWSTPEASLIGNALEKGTSASFPFERTESIVALEATLPDGTIYSSYGDGEMLIPAHPDGIGPQLDGLFLQNGLGIVTKMSFALARIPKDIRVLYVKQQNSDGLDIMLKELHQLKNRLGDIFASFKIESPLRTITSFTPYHALNQHTDSTVPEGHIERRTEELHLGAWNIFLVIQGEPALVKSAASIASRALRSLSAAVYCYDPIGLERRRKIFSYFPQKIRERYSHLKLAAHYMHRTSGINSGENAFIPFWRYEGATPFANIPILKNLDDSSKSGFMLFVAALPLHTPMKSLLEEIERICRANNIEPLYSLGMMSSRHMRFSLQMVFDKASDAGTASANRCYEEVFKIITENGGLPYRLPSSMFHLLSRIQPHLWPLAEKIRTAVDPHSLLAPGRYTPPKAAHDTIREL